MSLLSTMGWAMLRWIGFPTHELKSLLEAKANGFEGLDYLGETPQVSKASAA